MEKKELIYTGKAKAVYSTNDPHLVIIHFRDDATAFDGLKKGQIGDKGRINCTVTAHIYKELEKIGIKTHFVDQVAPNELLCKLVKILPIEVVMRNIVAGSLHKRTGLPEGTALKHPIYELFYKSDELHDPMITEQHVSAFGWATEEEIEYMKATSRKINDILVPAMRKVNILLVDYKLEYGKTESGEVLLADEITPDGCRLWDATTMEKLDKDRFRRDMGGVEDAYNEAERRFLSITL